MRVIVVGCGYVGLVSGACFAELGNEVVCVDANPARVAELEAGHCPIYEPGLEELIARNRQAGRLSFARCLPFLGPDVDLVMIAVGTPPARGGGADLSAVHAVAEEIALKAHARIVVATKSTVPPGTGDAVERIIRAARPGLDVSVASNPEFLREGSALSDFLRPDRIVIGTQDPQARIALMRLYRPLTDAGAPLVATTRIAAEITKYAANAFLALKITFINEIADLCEAAAADVRDVAHGIGLDHRIGKEFLRAGPGYGGSCFPKDTKALLQTAYDFGTEVSIVDAVVRANDARKKRMAERIAHALGGDINGKRIAVLGVTFKPNTDDMRDAPSLDIIPALQKSGASIVAFDPEGMHEARQLLPRVDWAADAYGTMKDADALVILTEWNEFRALDLKRVKSLLLCPLIVDLRNIYTPAEMQDAGFEYHSVGRALVKG